MAQFRRVTLRCKHKVEADAKLEPGDWYPCLKCGTVETILVASIYAREGDVPHIAHGRRAS